MTDWIAVDWGTSNVRAWAMRGGSPMAQASSDRGMGRLDRDGFEGALLDLIGGWAGQGDVIACGMVGARQGWIEAPYAMTPCPALPRGLITAPARTPGLRVRIIPGVAQSAPADVMRGEETQIAGFLRLNPGWDGTLCLPGSHTKWVQVSAGEIVSFQTFMTGEMFAALGSQTVLRHSLNGEGTDEDTFAAAVDDAMAHPARLGARLFSIRAEGLLHGLTAAQARGRLSGLLIGLELAGARPYWLGARVAVIGAGALARRYAAALLRQGLTPAMADNDSVTLAGLIAAHEGATP
ncbi:MAG: 2-dehydro-3-deoxygalactonokinase [Rubellimicrobium sp.]|nr:2-dehydro-3-deoxygalactonokinase [Rubellimicrobium sp.]